MNKSKDSIRVVVPTIESIEELFNKASITKNLIILELDYISKPIQAKYENYINYIDKVMDYLINNQLLKRSLTPEMKQWEKYERKTNIDETHYQIIEAKYGFDNEKENISSHIKLSGEMIKGINLDLTQNKNEKGSDGEFGKKECDKGNKHPNYKDLPILGQEIVKILSTGEKIKHQKLREILEERMPNHDIGYLQSLAHIFRKKAYIFYQNEIKHENGCWYLENPEIYKII